MQHQHTPKKTVPRQAHPEQGPEAPTQTARSPTVDDLALSLCATPVQLDAFDDAVSSFWGAVEERNAADRAEVQLKADAFSRATRAGAVQRAAATGVATSAAPLPHLAAIQQSFGPGHDLSGISAHVGGAARDACQEMGAHGYATGDHVAFAAAPSLALAAHEAAHVVQQRSGTVQLSGGVGAVGDRWETNADAVAARVVAGRSAADLLPAAGVESPGVQRALQLDEAAQGEAPQSAAADGSESKKDPAKDKFSGEKTYQYGEFKITLKQGNTSSEIKAELGKQEGQLPLFGPVFGEAELKSYLVGKGDIKADHTFSEVSLGGEVTGQVTVRGGIPKVASVGGGGKVKAEIKGLRLARGADGFKLSHPEFAIKAAFVIDAKLDPLTAVIEKLGLDKAGFNVKTKLEWNPGGEAELLKAAIGPDGKVALSVHPKVVAFFSGLGSLVTAGLKEVKDAFFKTKPTKEEQAAADKAWDAALAKLDKPDDAPLPFPQ